MPKRTRPTSDPDHPARRLIAAASAAFSSRGFDQTSLEDIAIEARLPRTGVYYYFPSKVALLIAIVEAAQTQFRARLDAIDQTVRPPDAALTETLRVHVRFICEDVSAMRVLVRETERLPPDTPGLQPILARRRHYRERLGALIRQGITLGLFAPVDVTLAVEAVLAVANSVMNWLPASDSLDPDAVSESCARLAVRALREMPAAPGGTN